MSCESPGDGYQSTLQPVAPGSPAASQVLGTPSFGTGRVAAGRGVTHCPTQDPWPQLLIWDLRKVPVQSQSWPSEQEAESGEHDLLEDHG